MNRREAIKKVALIFGGALSASTLAVFQQGCSRSAESVREMFTASDIDKLDAIANSIIPETDSPGARAAKVGSFIAVMLGDCYQQQDRDAVLELLKHVAAESFLSAASADQSALIGSIDAQAYRASPGLPEALIQGYRIVKELTLLGYFSSEAGVTRALGYVQIPGRYQGCVDLQAGQKPWADYT